MTPEIAVLDPQTASEADLLALYELEGLLHEESTPDDPRPSAPNFIASQRADRGEHHRILLLARGDDRLDGAAWIFWSKGDDNRHLARVYVLVHPDRRRRGVGTALLGRAAAIASEDGRVRLQGWTNSRQPAGEEFCRAVGAVEASVLRESRLDLGKLDRDLLRRWLDEPHPGYELVFIELPTPPELLAATAAIVEVMNTAPRDDLDEEDFKFTPDMLVKGEQALLAGGHRGWRYLAREQATGAIVGYTQVMWNTDDPSLVGQGDTAVQPEHRGHKLGKWMKAAMLEKLLAEVPQARSVVTGNAESNDAMLGINVALGFEPAASEGVWQVETEAVVRYTSRQSARPLE